MLSVDIAYSPFTPLYHKRPSLSNQQIKNVQYRKRLIACVNIRLSISCCATSQIGYFLKMAVSGKSVSKFRTKVKWEWVEDFLVLIPCSHLSTTNHYTNFRFSHRLVSEIFFLSVGAESTCSWCVNFSAHLVDAVY